GDEPREPVDHWIVVGARHHLSLQPLSVIDVELVVRRRMVGSAVGRSLVEGREDAEGEIPPLPCAEEPAPVEPSGDRLGDVRPDGAFGQRAGSGDQGERVHNGNPPSWPQATRWMYHDASGEAAEEWSTPFPKIACRWFDAAQHPQLRARSRLSRP